MIIFLLYRIFLKNSHDFYYTEIILFLLQLFAMLLYCYKLILSLYLQLHAFQIQSFLFFQIHASKFFAPKELLPIEIVLFVWPSAGQLHIGHTD